MADGFQYLRLQYLRLATKPTAELCYAFWPAVAMAKPVLVVFLNGMGMPQDGWQATMAQLQARRQGQGQGGGGGAMPAFLTYDRFGQGRTTDRGPADEGAADPMHAHDCLSAVGDLRQLVVQVAADWLGSEVQGHDIDSQLPPLVLVGNSLGCALARLYAQAHPGTVAALLLLDSVLANANLVDVMPDPDAPGFDAASSLPPDVTEAALRATRASLRRTFHPDVGSREGLSRRNLRALLPASDAPVLQGPDGRGPFITVVGHEFAAFADEAARNGTPPGLSHAYTNSYWQRYNEGLARLTEPARSRGPLQAPHAGHFVQRDNPEFVAAELDGLLRRMGM